MYNIEMAGLVAPTEKNTLAVMLAMSQQLTDSTLPTLCLSAMDVGSKLLEENAILCAVYGREHTGSHASDESAAD